MLNSQPQCTVPFTDLHCSTAQLLQRRILNWEKWEKQWGASRASQTPFTRNTCISIIILYSSTFAILVIIKVIMIITILVNIILRPKMFGARCQSLMSNKLNGGFDHPGRAAKTLPVGNHKIYQIFPSVFVIFVLDKYKYKRVKIRVSWV